MAKTLTQMVSDSDSLEISRNAKGEYSYTVKIYFEGDAKPAKEKIVDLDKWFKETFPKEVPQK